MATATVVPPKVFKVIKEIVADDTMNTGIKTIQTRVPETTKSQLIGIANDPKALKHWDAKMDAMWASNKLRDADEIIIGGGFHAATYAAVRSQIGANKPLVIEKDRVGGNFAVSQKSTFFLNSGNRPGLLSTPGQGGALNGIPGAPVQPSDLTGDEYQGNAALGFCIRATLAMHADVVQGETIKVTEQPSAAKRRYRIDLKDGTFATADRVIMATGLGKPNEIQNAPKNDPRVMTFEQFMRHIDDNDFPLKDLNRVAVIGSGDGGKVVMEALTGRGPGTQWSTSSLDYVKRIDWYGQNFQFREDFCGSARSRYQGLGRLFPRRDNGGSNAFSAQFGERRMKPIQAQAQFVEAGFDAAYVDGQPYDLVIIAIGYRGGGISDISLDTAIRDRFEIPREWTTEVYTAGEGRGRNLGRRITGQEFYLVGPVSIIPLDGTEQRGVGVPENSAAIWRYAPRTANMAKSLTVRPTPQPTPEPALDNYAEEPEVIYAEAMPEIDEEAVEPPKKVAAKKKTRKLADMIADPYARTVSIDANGNRFYS